MFRVGGKKQHTQKSQGTTHSYQSNGEYTRSGASDDLGSQRTGTTTGPSQEDLISLKDIMQRPKRVLHSKNPFKTKVHRIPLHLREREDPLDANSILRICKCEYPEEVLKLNISGKGYRSIYKNDLKNFINLMELDASENRIHFEDIDFLLNINKLNISANELVALDIRPNTLPNLQILDLSFNNIAPMEVSKVRLFTRLKELQLVGNKLDRVPEDMISLQSLEVLNLSHNLLKSDGSTSKLWRTLADFRNLRELSVSGNKLRGIHTEYLVAGDFATLEVLDFRNNLVDDERRLICARNFINLKKLFVTGNEFCNYPYDYLKSELDTRVGAEIINETVSYKLQQDLLHKKRVPIIFENFVVIKTDEFRRKVNTEFFGVDIPVPLDSSQPAPNQRPEEAKNEMRQIEDGFFLTGAGVEVQDQRRANEDRESPFPPNIYDYKLDANFEFDNLPYKTYLNFSKLYLGSDIDYERPLELADAYKGLRNSLRNGISLDKRLQNPDYLRPLRVKQRRFNSSVDSGGVRPRNVGKLSAFNTDKRMAGVKMLTEGVSQKMRLPPVHPAQQA